MPITKINHIAIAVTDLDRSIAFHRDVLKLPFHGVQTVESAGCKVAFFACGDTEVELVQGITDTAYVTKYIAEKGEGLYHIAYEVDDLAQEMERFKEQGIQLRNPAPKPGANNTLVNYIDGDVICELVQKQ